MKGYMVANYNGRKNRAILHESEYEYGITGVGLLISIIMGMICQFCLYTIMEINAFEIPILISIILWVVFTGLVALVMDATGV